jgi:iron complex transport system ATP-binding protein
MEKIINIENLQVGYKTPIVNNINLSAEKSNLICIIGKNGTGKSTFLKTLAGIIPQLKGNIFINNSNLKSISALQKAKYLSFVPAKLSNLANISLRELVKIGRTPYTNLFDKLSVDELDLIQKSLEKFNLNDIADKSLLEVSDGERQKAMICRAFVQNSPVILLDEPTAFLDYPSKVELLLSLKKLSEEHQKTIVFSSHDLEIALNYADRIWLFNDENIINLDNNNVETFNILKRIFNFNKKNISQT